MKLDLTAGIQHKGITVAFDLQEQWAEDTFKGDSILFIEPIAVSGTYLLAEDTVIVRGTVSAVIEVPCARCLTPTSIPVTAELDEAFIRDLGQERSPEDDQYLYSGHVLDLDEAVRTALLLELPSRVLCKQDCRGLCDQCGANLNLKACSCQKDLIRKNPFSALASLLNEDEEV